VRYQGTHPQRFEDKYKELDPERAPETITSGKTPAGQHQAAILRWAQWKERVNYSTEDRED